MNVAHELRRTERALARARLRYGHGTACPRAEAAWLVAAALGMAPANLKRNLRRRLGAPERRRIAALLRRRVRERIPLAYALREAWLEGVPFFVDHRALVPRSYIAALLRAKLRPWLRMPVRRALDLCTGSGCLAVLMARAFPRARIDASELSPAALAVARRNVERHGLQRRIALRRSDLFDALGRRRYDLIACNPPYVTDAAMRRLPPEYRHEPRIALAGGRDGLTFVRRILRLAARHLTARGMLICEIGGNRRALERTCPDLPFVWPEAGPGTGAVFILERAALSASARKGARPRARPRPQAARR